MTPWWWLSFCDPDRPEGDKFIGVSLVQASSGVGAVLVARERGCNPGGEVMMMQVPSEHGNPPAGYVNRLLSKVEAEEMQALWTPADPRVLSIAEHEEEALS